MFMKRKVRRLLSLLMVLAMLCTLIPAAFAATATADDYDWDLTGLTEMDWFKYAIVCNDVGHTPSSSGYNTTCSVCGAVGTRYGSGSGSGNYYGHEHKYTYINSSYHEEECHSHNDCYYWTARREAHDHASYCTLCGWNYDSKDTITWDEELCMSRLHSDYDHDPVFWKTGGNYDYYYCGYSDCDATGTAPRGSSVTDDGLVLTPDDNLSAADTYEENAGGIYVKIEPTVTNYDYNYNTYRGDVTSFYDFSYTWTVNGVASSVTTKQLTVDTSKTYNDITVTVTATPKTGYASSLSLLTGTYSWYATCGSAINVTATIYNTNTGYVLSDADDEGNTSIEEQIANAVSALGSRYTTCTLDAVKFTSVSETGGTLSAYTRYEYDYSYSYGNNSNYLGDVVFYPTAGHVGKVSFGFTAYYYVNNSGKRQETSGTLTFDVKQGGTGLGIVYSAISGENVELNEADFVNFWEEAYPYGTLDYVKFGSISTAKGTLYDGYGYTAGTKIRTTDKCYYQPTRNAIGLDDLTFVPKNSSVTSLEIGFTAYGSTRYNYNSSTSLTGTITILYTDKEVTPIKYESTGAAITLKEDDFLAKYKEVMGVKNATGSSLSVQFLEAPAYGSLYLNYKADSTANKGTQLTSKNILNYSFSGNARATRSIGDVTYVPAAYGSAAESLKFACYYNNQLKFVGTVEFGATDPIVVEYTTMGTNPVSFAGYDFIDAAKSSGYVYFGTPAYGTLYRNYANGTGTKVNNYDTFTTSSISYGNAYSLSTVTYVPPAGYVGVVEFPIYSALSVVSTQKIGTVKIYVGRAFTDVMGTISAWSAPYVNKLSAQGIVSGTNTAKTLFSPTKTVSYGEALKLIMMAAGYPDLAKTGTHWASGFLSKAVSDGLVSANVDLNAEVTRDEIAAITAKALGLGYSYSVDTGVVKPSDSTNGYVYSLYNAGIVEGTYVNGINYFYGSKSITRAEISKIVCMIADYEK